MAGLFSRRGFNIFSLAVAPTDDDERFSRITIVVDVESAPLEQIMKQLDKLVNVVTITELAPAEAVERELLLVTVAAGADRALAGHPAGRACSRARSSTSAPTALTVMLAGRPAKIDDFEDLLRALRRSSSSSGPAGWPCLSWTASRPPATASAPEQRPTARERQS